jgi:sialate O-acetylesterase
VRHVAVAAATAALALTAAAKSLSASNATPTLTTTAQSLSASIAIVPSALAEVKLPRILSDHMVLQSGKTSTLWGWADPQEKVTVTLGDKTASTTADALGKWSLKLEVPGSKSPLEMTVSGKNTLKVQDILVGEVWICSGQSNMEWTVKQSDNAAAEATAGNYPLIRHFKVTKTPATTPQEDLQGAWVVCTPETVSDFSGVGYFFGRELHKQLAGTPIGLIASNWGGTPVESWASRASMEAEASLRPFLDRWDQQVAAYDPAKAQENFEKAKAAWPKQAEDAKAASKPVPRQPNPPTSPALSSGRPANLYNGMIAPLLPLSVKGPQHCLHQLLVA